MRVRIWTMTREVILRLELIGNMETVLARTAVKHCLVYCIRYIAAGGCAFRVGWSWHAWRRAATTVLGGGKEDGTWAIRWARHARTTQRAAAPCRTCACRCTRAGLERSGRRGPWTSTGASPTRSASRWTRSTPSARYGLARRWKRRRRRRREWDWKTCWRGWIEKMALAPRGEQQFIRLKYYSSSDNLLLVIFWNMTMKIGCRWS